MKSRLLGGTLMLAFGGLNQSLAAVEPADLTIEPPVLIGPRPFRTHRAPLGDTHDARA